MADFDELSGLSDLRLMRRPEVERACGISRSLLYLMVAKETFPQPVRINDRAVGWRVGDVKAWLKSRPYALDTDWR